MSLIDMGLVEWRLISHTFASRAKHTLYITKLSMADSGGNFLQIVCEMEKPALEFAHVCKIALKHSLHDPF